MRSMGHHGLAGVPRNDALWGMAMYLLFFVMHEVRVVG